MVRRDVPGPGPVIRDRVPRTLRRSTPRRGSGDRAAAFGDGPATPTVCLFGVAAAHRNLGVGALRAAAAAELIKREPDCRLTVFDEGWGQRAGQVLVAGRWVPIELCGVRNSRRLHRRESYLNMRLSAALGGLGNPGLARIDAADAVFDISGGDSFSDLYGEHRFHTVAWPKRLAVLRRRPLVLLPQTYGPFRSPKLRAQAAGLLRAAAMAWARDADSYQAMLELLGDDADPARYRLGVDVAFALEPREPDEALRDLLAEWFAGAPGPVAGINISGLLTRPAHAAGFGLAADGGRVLLRLGERLLAESDARLLIVPHVHTPGEADDDVAAARWLADTLAARHPDRVLRLPAGLDQHQTKWAIARTDWFCGARMHATIAALSSTVPSAVLAYSDKARGVFAGVGQQGHVADARRLGDTEVDELLWSSWTGRARARAELTARVPEMLRRAGEQMDEILTCVRGEAAAPPRQRAVS